MDSEFEIRADYDAKTIIVYQAYSDKIALSALKGQKFVSPFSFTRMTWIKPSFLWLMERSNWGQKSGQEYILAIRIKRDGWEKALQEGVLTSPEKRVYKNAADWDKEFKNARVHIQWDPEMSLRGQKLSHRSIQVGISRFLIEEYVRDWIVEIIDYTPRVKKILTLIQAGKHDNAKKLLPIEKPYALSNQIKKRIGGS